jgi:SAM-dependent methyltransferase
MTSTTAYLLTAQAAERQRLELQSRVWEPAAEALLGRLPTPRPGTRVVDVGCGAMGWLRVLSRWVGPSGEVVGCDFDPGMLEHARAFAEAEGLTNVTLVPDDVFASRLPTAAFDLVHARFMLSPLGRGDELLATLRRIGRPGAHLVMEESDPSSWRINPDAPATARLVELIVAAFRAAGADFAAGRVLPGLLRRHDLSPSVTAHVVALEPAHPYLRLPLQFATSLRTRLETLVAAAELDALVQQAETEIARPDAWGTSFMVVQAHALLPA